MISVVRLAETDFAALRGEWNALLERSRNPGPMLTWEWLWSWWETYRRAETARELQVLAARTADGELIGLAPFVRRTARAWGVWLRRLEFLGTGEAEADETCSEFLDLIVAADREAACVPALAAALAADPGWDEIVARDVRTDRPASLDALRRSAAGWRAAEFGRARCPFIPLPDTWEQYLASLSRNSRRLARYKRKRLAEAGRLAFRLAESESAVMELWPEFVRLHQGSWAARGRAGCFASETFGTFLKKATARLAAAGGVRLALLTLNDEPLALYHLLRHGPRLYYYNSGAAAGRWAEYSPGSVCQGFIIEEAIAEGLEEYHLFKAGPDSYKYHWTDRAAPVSSWRLRRPGWKARWCALCETLAGAGRAWRRRARREARR